MSVRLIIITLSVLFLFCHLAVLLPACAAIAASQISVSSAPIILTYLSHMFSLAVLVIITAAAVWIVSRTSNRISDRLLRKKVSKGVYIRWVISVTASPLLLLWIAPFVLSLGTCGGWMDSPPYPCSLSQSLQEHFSGIGAYLWTYIILLVTPLWIVPCTIVFWRRWNRRCTTIL